MDVTVEEKRLMSRALNGKDLKKHSECSTFLSEPTIIGLYDLVTKATVIFYKILCLSEDFCTLIQANGNSTNHNEETRFDQSK